MGIGLPAARQFSAAPRWENQCLPCRGEACVRAIVSHCRLYSENQPTLLETFSFPVQYLMFAFLQTHSVYLSRNPSQWCLQEMVCLLEEAELSYPELTGSSRLRHPLHPWEMGLRELHTHRAPCSDVVSPGWQCDGFRGWSGVMPHMWKPRARDGRWPQVCKLQVSPCYRNKFLWREERI